jgi:hypothetical protein
LEPFTGLLLEESCRPEKVFFSLKPAWVDEELNSWVIGADGKPHERRWRGPGETAFAWFQELTVLVLGHGLEAVVVVEEEVVVVVVGG